MTHARGALWFILLFHALAVVHSTDMNQPSGVYPIQLPTSPGGDGGDAAKKGVFDGQAPIGLDKAQLRPPSDSFVCIFETQSLLQPKATEKWTLAECHAIPDCQAPAASLVTLIRPISPTGPPAPQFEKDLLQSALQRADSNDRSVTGDDLRKFESASMSPQKALPGVQVCHAPMDTVTLTLGNDPKTLQANLGKFCTAVKSVEQQKAHAGRKQKEQQQRRRKAEQQAQKLAAKAPPPQTVMAPTGPGGTLVPQVLTTAPPIIPREQQKPGAPPQKPDYVAPTKFIQPPLTLHDDGVDRAQGTMYVVPLNVQDAFRLDWPGNCDAAKLGDMWQPSSIMPVEGTKLMHVSEKVLRVMEMVGYIKNVKHTRAVFLRRAATGAKPQDTQQVVPPPAITNPLAVVETMDKL